MAAANNSGGSRPKSTTSGSNATAGTPGTKDAAAPTTTRTTGADQPTLRDRPVTVTVTTTNDTIQMMVVTGSMLFMMAATQEARQGFHQTVENLFALGDVDGSPVRPRGPRRAPRRTLHTPPAARGTPGRRNCAFCW